MAFSDIMQLEHLEKQQLIELCDALYQLLQNAPQVPAFTFIPRQPLPYIAPSYPTLSYVDPIEVNCSSAGESTQQERFGCK